MLRYLAVDEGVLVKEGAYVRLSCRDVVIGDDLGALEAAVREQFLSLDERERVSRTAIARLEADFIRRMMDL